jgi:serine/threonine protein kinase
MGAGTTDPRSSARLPEQFGKYSILGHLATGGMAEVYLARQAGLHGFQKIVVIKRVRPEVLDGQTLSFFLDEARLVATLEHPNIAQVYEIGQVDGSYFFVMEYVHGADLRQLMEAAVAKGMRVSLGDALYIIIGVCAALHYAHEKHDFEGRPLSIIHRDISPSNVLLSHDGAVKVCDFGIAKARNRKTETVRGALKGKFAYMSPEQCRAKPLDRRSDLFSIGILLYELSTLSRAFSQPNDFDLLKSIIEQPIEPPSVRVQDYPPELERIVNRALEKDPDNRYATAQEMQLDLEHFARENKLAMSSVNIAHLMGALFEKRIDEWLRAQREGRALADYLLDTAVPTSDRGPVFLPMGTQQAQDITICEDMDTGVRDAVDTRPSMPRMPQVKIVTPPPVMQRKRIPEWLAGGIVGLIVAAALTVFGMARKPVEIDPTVFEPDARAIAGALDASARAAHLRADGAASAPMLRAAIETDAATLADLAKNERLFTPGPHETVEIFQVRDGRTTPLLRMPAEATPLRPIAGREARVECDGKDVEIVVAAPIAGYKPRINGTLAIAMPVDLATVQRGLAERAGVATITGLASDVPLVAPRETVIGSPLSVPIPTSPDLGASLRLQVVPLGATAGPPAWLDPVRFASLGIAAVMFALYAFTRRASTLRSR